MGLRRHFIPVSLFRYSFWKPGVWFIDMAFYRKDLKKDNDQCESFLLVVNALSHVLVALPTPDKTSESWKEALDMLVREKAADISLLVSDQDTAVNPMVRRHLYTKYQIGWNFSKHRSKAYLAEIYIK